MRIEVWAYRQIPFIRSPSKVPPAMVTHRRKPYGPVPISILVSKAASSLYKCFSSIFGMPFVMLIRFSVKWLGKFGRWELRMGSLRGSELRLGSSEPLRQSQLRLDPVVQQIRCSDNSMGTQQSFAMKSSILKIAFSALLPGGYVRLEVSARIKRSSELREDRQICGEGFIFHFRKPLTVRIAQWLFIYSSVNVCHRSRAEGRPPAVQITLIRYHQELIPLGRTDGDRSIYPKTVGAKSRLNPIADTFFELKKHLFVLFFCGMIFGQSSNLYSPTLNQSIECLTDFWRTRQDPSPINSR
jgi:hypothetical protein